MTFYEIFSIAYGIGVILALMLTLVLCMVYGMAERRYLTDGEDIAFFFCFVGWTLGPIAVVIYTVCIIYWVKSIITGENDNTRRREKEKEEEEKARKEGRLDLLYYLK